MGVCYWCFWGWPKEVAEIYNEALVELQKIGDEYGEQDLEYGPAHIVWCEENWEDDSVRFCIEACDDTGTYNDVQPAVLAIIRASLVKLLGVPIEMRTEPDGYLADDDHPEKYPPPSQWQMMQRKA